MPASTVRNVEGSFGVAADIFPSAYNPRESNESAITIAKNDLVRILSDGKVKQSAVADDQLAKYGVAMEAIAPGAVGNVAELGLVDVKADGAIAANALIARSAAVVGAVATFAPAVIGDVGKSVGVALAAAAGNVVRAWIEKV